MELTNITGNTYVAPRAISAEEFRGTLPINGNSDENRNMLHEKAVREAEFVKRFLYMLAGIPYESPEKGNVAGDGSRWA